MSFDVIYSDIVTQLTFSIFLWALLSNNRSGTNILHDIIDINSVDNKRLATSDWHSHQWCTFPAAFVLICRNNHNLTLHRIKLIVLIEFSATRPLRASD